MTRPNIILTGFMGTGKTTVGKMLAERLSYDFIDTDHVIETRNNLSVAEIFETQGEESFREMEASLARELAEKEGLVISTGGRMMLDAGNTDALGRNGRIFCLTATPDEIVARVRLDKTVRRPLLETGDPMARIVKLMEERKQGYNQFHQVTTSGKSPGEVLGEVIRNM